MSKKVYFDKVYQWQVEDVETSYIAGTGVTMVMMRVISSGYTYYLPVGIFESDRFEEVVG